MFMEAIPIERDAVVWAMQTPGNRLCPVTTWVFQCCQYHGELTNSNGQYCTHFKVCMHLNCGICTFSTDYLNCLLAYDVLQCVTFVHNLAYTARPCYTVVSIINAQISLVPRLPISFLLALPVIKRRLPLNLCIHSLFHHQQSTYINTGNIQCHYLIGSRN